MKTCDRCGRPSDYSTCTLCSSIERERYEDIQREEEARAERLDQLREDQERARENAERIAEARINPGEYSCPECLYRTLKYRAKRCPTCQASIGFEYWTQVDERRKIEAERAAERARAEAKAAKEKWEREAPARAKVERDAAENKAKGAAENRSVVFLQIFYGYLLPILGDISAMSMKLGFDGAVDAFQKNGILGNLVLFVPVVNWLGLTLAILFGDDRSLALTALFCWGLVGLVIGYVIRKSVTSK